MDEDTSKQPVALLRYDGNLHKTLSNALHLIGGMGTLKQPVLIKPNICASVDGTGHSTTDVEVVRVLTEMIVESHDSCPVRIVESDSLDKYAMEAYQNLGYSQMVEELRDEGYDIELVDLSEPKLVKIKLGGEYFKELELHEILTKQHSLISVAVAKTHGLTFLTGAVKNLFGLLPRKDQDSYHSHIDSVIADLARYVNTDLSIIDARTAVEGWNGPGTKKVGAFVIGREPVSVDAVLTRLLGFRPEEVSHLMKLASEDLGSLNPRIVGEQLDKLSVKLKSPKL